MDGILNIGNSIANFVIAPGKKRFIATPLIAINENIIPIYATQYPKLLTLASMEKIMPCWAAHGIAIAINDVAIIRSFFVANIRVEIVPITLQPKPKRIGIMASPFSPKKLKNFLVRIAIRGI